MAKVLVLEDDDSLREMLEEICQELLPGLGVLKAASVGEAMEHYHQNHDIEVMFVDGRLKAQTSTPFVRFVRKSGFAGLLVAISSDLNEELRDAGCNESIPKPFGVRKIREVLERYPRLTGDLL